MASVSKAPMRPSIARTFLLSLTSGGRLISALSYSWRFGLLRRLWPRYLLGVMSNIAIADKALMRCSVDRTIGGLQIFSSCVAIVWAAGDDLCY